MISIAWAAYDDVDCDSFNVYRSVPGFVVPFPNALQVNDELRFAATSPDIQTITFTAVDIDSVVTQFNAAAKGMYAAKTDAGDAIIFRLNATSKAKLKLYNCLFLDHVSQSARIIVPELEWALLDNVPLVVNVFEYDYSDLDGTELDSYRITSVSGVEESLPSLVQKPVIGVDLLCAVEGRVVDSVNRPVQGLIVRAEVRVPMAQTDGHGLDGHPVEVKTDDFGRFTIYLPRCGVYLLQIPAVGYNETIQVPDQASAGFLDIIPTLAGRFSPFEDPQ